MSTSSPRWANVTSFPSSACVCSNVAVISPLEHFHSGSQSAFGLEPFGNGGTVALELGDILCFKGGTTGLGHVAIIREVGKNYVKAIQQNLNRDALENSLRYAMSVSRGKHKVSAAALGAKYVCQGWLRKAPPPTLRVISAGDSPAEARGSADAPARRAPTTLAAEPRGTLQLRFTGQDGRVCLLQTSDNLTEWQTVRTFTGRGTGVDLDVRLDPTASCRFLAGSCRGGPARFVWLTDLAGLNHVHNIARDPDLNLVKALLQSLLQPGEESAVFLRIFHVEHQTRVVIAMHNPFVSPNAANNLAVPRDRAKMGFQLLDGLPQQMLGNCATVIKLEREEDFVSSAGVHAPAAGTPAAEGWAFSFRRKIRSYVPAPSTENMMPSAAKCGRAGSGTKTSPVAQLLPEKRPSRYPSARLRISTVGKRIMTM